MNSIYPFQTQEVRDLAWACFSPPMIRVYQPAEDVSVRDCTPELTATRRQWLEQLDRKPGALLEHLGRSTSTRLGIYFEALWQFFLQQDPAYELVAHNLRVHDQGRTLGEFDCIYFCHQRGRFIHLELAAKFFLYGPPAADTEAGHNWLGPNTKDRLDVKLDHLMQRQIRLATQPAAQDVLDALGIQHPLQEIALKGYLFHNPDHRPRLPAGYDMGQTPGMWLYPQQLSKYLAQAATHSFKVLHRLQWLSPAIEADPHQRLSAGALNDWIKRHFSDSSAPVLVAKLDSFGTESSRFFVTNQDWPGTR